MGTTSKWKNFLGFQNGEFKKFQKFQIMNPTTLQVRNSYIWILIENFSIIKL
jgi:hypothetical protein